MLSAMSVMCNVTRRAGTNVNLHCRHHKSLSFSTIGIAPPFKRQEGAFTKTQPCLFILWKVDAPAVKISR